MFLNTRSEARYRLALSTAIIENRRAIYSALVYHRHDCLAAELAEFMLKEARWDRDEFVQAYLAGELSG